MTYFITPTTLPIEQRKVTVTAAEPVGPSGKVLSSELDKGWATAGEALSPKTRALTLARSSHSPRKTSPNEKRSTSSITAIAPLSPVSPALKRQDERESSELLRRNQAPQAGTRRTEATWATPPADCYTCLTRGSAGNIRQLTIPLRSASCPGARLDETTARCCRFEPSRFDSVLR